MEGIGGNGDATKGGISGDASSVGHRDGIVSVGSGGDRGGGRELGMVVVRLVRAERADAAGVADMAVMVLMEMRLLLCEMVIELQGICSLG